MKKKDLFCISAELNDITSNLYLLAGGFFTPEFQYENTVIGESLHGLAAHIERIIADIDEIREA